MTQISKSIPRIGLNSVLLLVSAATLAACGTGRPYSEPVSSTKPTITYAYNDDRALMDATNKAQSYCATYNAWPRTDSIYNKPEGGRNVTFVCDQPRNAPVSTTTTSAVIVPNPAIAPAPTQPVVSYSYRDDRGLVEATGMATRYCNGYGAQARSTSVQGNVDGSKTITFDCVKTM